MSTTFHLSDREKAKIKHLKYVEKLTESQIAERFGKSKGSISAFLHREKVKEVKRNESC